MIKIKNYDIPEKEYDVFLEEIKHKIRLAKVTASMSANQILIRLYWDIGKSLLEKERANQWGARVIEKMAFDLGKEFPGVRGFAWRNLYSMRRFAEAYEQIDTHLNVFTLLPWGHNIVLLEKLKRVDERLWYAQKIIQNGWSRSMLLLWVDSDLYNREGKAITNFDRALPQPQSDLARELIKDPYCFDFLTLREGALEKDLEHGLALNVQKFLLELGTGFAFIGRQFRIDIDEEEYYIDLLFYHYVLKCFIPVELKATAFRPEYVGKLNFYLVALDHKIKRPDDNPSIGMLLCKTKKKLTVEYALQNFMTPMGVASYETKATGPLPGSLKDALPSAELIEQLLQGEADEGIDISANNPSAAFEEHL